MRRFFRKLKILIRGDKFNRELEEEMVFHREQAEREFQAAGMSAEEAHHAARRQFGNDVRLKEQSYEVTGFQFESVLQDLRYAVRQLMKNPGFAGTAILILALGICANVAIFGFVDSALIKPLPFSKPGRLVALFESISVGPKFHLSYPDYLDWKSQNTVFSALEAYEGSSFSLDTPSGAQYAAGGIVSDGFFRLLGVAPALGRDFHSGEDQPSAQRVVILSYAAWQKRFGGRQDVLGQTVVLDGAPNTVVGVLPRDFYFTLAGPAEFWRTFHRDGRGGTDRGAHGISGIARLKDGVSIEAAAANMRGIADRLAKQYPDDDGGRGATVLPLAEAMMGDIRPVLLLLLSGAGLLLLITCVNVASLLLVRSESRKREIAVRGALGASPARLTRQFVTESLVLAAISSMLGLALAYVATQLLVRLIPAARLANMPYLQGAGVNLHTAVFAFGISLMAGALFSLVPAMRLSGMDVREGLAAGGRGFAGTLWRRLGSNLVVVELATAMVLLVAAGLLGKSLYLLLHVDTGLNPEHLATLRVGADGINYTKNEQQVALGRQIIERVSALPGVTSVAITEKLPVGDGGGFTAFKIAGRPYHGEDNEANARQISANYFATVQARLLHGRYFSDAEDASKPQVVLINRTMARQYFPGENPIGQRIDDGDTPQTEFKEIIGVVDDIKEGPLDTETMPTMYAPFNQSPSNYFFVIVRTAQSEEAIFPTLTAAIHQVDPGIISYNQATMNDCINNTYLHRSAAWLVGGFAALALLLGVVGLYGVIAYSVSQRTREIGVRMALGAERGSVYKLILREAGSLTATGIIAGLVCSVAAATLMRKLLFGVRAWDVSTLVGVAVVLGVCALLASYLPARRAASVNPVEALRAE
jgi:predicted permease